MAPFDGASRSGAVLPLARLPAERRASLVQDIATGLLLPALAARFGAPPVDSWQKEASALAGTLVDGTLDEGIAALAALNPDGRMFRAICRDVIMPAASLLRRRFIADDGFDQTERISKVWQLRMCLLSLDDADSAAPLPGHAALTLSGAHAMPSVEHGVALRFFDRAGWDVSNFSADHAESDARDSAHDQVFDVAWISLEPGQDEAEVRATAQGLRRASRNAGILVLGGGVAGRLPESAGALDLDGFTGSPIEAAVVAEVALRLRRAGQRR